jgi:hypothetical protein
LHIFYSEQGERVRLPPKTETLVAAATAAVALIAAGVQEVKDAGIEEFERGFRVFGFRV